MNPFVYAEEWLRGTLRDPMQHFRPRTIRECPICGFKGLFLSAGRRQEVRCPSCSSKERDRIFGLYLKRHGISVEGKKILHFSAERPFQRQWKDFDGYVSGDIKKSRVSNAIVDITNIQFPDNHFDMIICHHVLEHVPEDRKGMIECFRVLKPGCAGHFSVPMSGKAETWEPPPEMPKEEVEAICGWDHRRLYGDDFVRRLEEAGFTVKEIEFSPEEEKVHRLSSIHSDRVFVATKPERAH